MTFHRIKANRLFSACALAFTVLGAGSTQALAADYQAVTDARLVNAAKDDGWLMYRHDYTASGYSPHGEINATNVGKLKVAWDYKSDLTQGHEGAPLVNGDVMIVTTPMDHVVAFDAATGKELWKYVAKINEKALKTVCCDVVNRGAALYENNVYLETLDNHVIALDAKTGKEKWSTKLWDPGVGYFMTSAPLIVKGKVIVGTGGGEYGARGFISALDAKTGKILWQTHTTAAPGEPGGDTWPKGAYQTGGGNPWLPGSYDTETDTLFWTVGNPGPWLATLRPGKNLYTDSVLALNPATGKIKWYYQWTENDTWDYDGTNEPILTDITYEGKNYKALVHADRNGYYYALDRTTGKPIYAEPFVHTNTVTGLKDGVNQTAADLRPTVDKQVFACPSFLGGKNWWPTAVDPTQHLVFIPTLNACMDIKGSEPVAYKAGLAFLDASFEVKHDPANNNWGTVQALDLNTGKQVWKFDTALPWNGPMLATGGGLVISGSSDGYLHAFDSKTGKVLWKSDQLTSGIIGVPTTYKVGGKQYIAVWAGWGGASPILGGQMANDPAVKAIPKGGHLYVFSL